MTELAIQQHIALTADSQDGTVDLNVEIIREDKNERVTIEISGQKYEKTFKSGMLFVSSLLLTVCKIKNINTNIVIR